MPDSSLPRRSEEAVTTIWWCENCGAEGSVDMDRGTGVYEGFDRIKSAHVAAGTACTTGSSYVRVSLDPVEPVGVPLRRDAGAGRVSS